MTTRSGATNTVAIGYHTNWPSVETVAIGSDSGSYKPKGGWELTLDGKTWLRDELESASDEKIEDLLNRTREEHRSFCGEHVYIPTVIENILLKRRVKRLEEKFAQLEEAILWQPGGVIPRIAEQHFNGHSLKMQEQKDDEDESGGLLDD